MYAQTFVNRTARHGLSRYLCLLLTLAGALPFATSAYAGCVIHPGSNPAMNVAALFPASLGTPPNGSNSIVGLWHVTYTAGGQLFYEAFDTWHSDGAEIESANFDPTEGNVCMGVWKLVGPSVHLYHVGWLFDVAGNSAGWFSLTERDIVAGNGKTYHGTFDYRAYDPNGNLVQEITGDLTATRIVVN
ncbi:MAG TPA: hypothetical protein VMT53_10160 [Terriglobales bacterium]|nr:hypothetical protein [Terriglobales bacterium]